MTLLNKVSLKQTSALSQLKHPNFLFFCWLVFAILGLIGILNHAMWRDELNGWLIARDSESLRQFIYNIRYEGHPLIWYSFLAILNKMTSHPVAMQLFHWLLALISVSIFILFSPFNKLQKSLFIFGYLPLYEYQLISRNYAIGMLSIFGVCALWQTRKKSYLWLSLMLAVMANTNAYCLLISMAFALTLGIEIVLFKQNWTIRIVNVIISSIIYILGSLSSIIMLFPPSDSNLQGGASEWFLNFDLYRLFQTLSRIWNGYILILVPKDSSFWDVALFAGLSLVLIGFFITLFKQKFVVLCFYLTGSCLILLFTYLKFLGSARHFGHLYLILIAALWLSSYYPKSQASHSNLNPSAQNSYWGKWQSLVKKWHKPLIILILFCQMIAGIVAFSRDLSIPYSASKETANYIKKHHLDQQFMVGSEDFTITPIAGYLNKKVYYPESQGLGSYVLFNYQRKPVNDAEIFQQLKTMLKYPNESILLILNHPLEIDDPDLNITPIEQFTKGFIYNEKYYLYEVRLSP